MLPVEKSRCMTIKGPRDEDLNGLEAEDLRVLVKYLSSFHRGRAFFNRLFAALLTSLAVPLTVTAFGWWGLVVSPLTTMFSLYTVDQLEILLADWQLEKLKKNLEQRNKNKTKEDQ